MSVIARYLCNTCMTVCYADGVRSFWRKATGTVSEVDALLQEFAHIKNLTYWDDDDEFSAKLRDLRKWLARHEGHKMLITNDHGVGSTELEQYKTETVDGVVSPQTHEEEWQVAVRTARENDEKRIAAILHRHGLRECVDSIVKEITKHQVYY